MTNCHLHRLGLILLLAAGVVGCAGGAPQSAMSTEGLTGKAVHFFAATQVPRTPADSDGNAVELGLRFWSDVDGSLTGVRFYKGTGNGGTHTASAWTLDGTRLAMVTFTQETQTGWQRAAFSTPVAIAAGTAYVVSYYAPQGHYAADPSFFAAPLDTGVLHASRVANGLYRYGASGFPTQTYQQTNYWVDVSFVPSAPVPAADAGVPSSDTSPPTAPSSLIANATSSSQISLSWATATDNVGVTGYRVLRGSTVVAKVPGLTYVDSGLASSTTYSYSVQAVDAAGNVGSASSPVSAVTGPPSPPTLTHGEQITAALVGLAGAGINPSTLRTQGATTVTVPGTVLEGIHFTGRLTIAAANVTVRHCYFDFSDTFQIRILAAATNWRVEWSTLRGTSNLANWTVDGIAVEDGASGTAYRLDISYFENGLNMGAGSLVESFLHDPIPNNGIAHRDQVEIYGSHHVQLLRNRIVHDADETSAINITCDFGPTDDVVIKDNFIDGGNFTIYDRNQGGFPTHIQFVGNVFGGHTNPWVGRYAIMSASGPGSADPAAQSATPTVYLWQANTWGETGDASRDGAAIPPPS